MKNIRHSVFETNSSSSHSISISEECDGVLDTIEPDDVGDVVLTGGEFGWAWERFNDAMTKANYCAVYAKEYGGSDLEMLKEVIREHTGAKAVVIAVDTDWHGHNYSYIDHESACVPAEAFSSKETLKNFIFNPKSYMFTGNDNETSPPNFYDVSPESQAYTHILEIEGYEAAEKFVKEPSVDELKEAARRIIESRGLSNWRTGDYVHEYELFSWPIKTRTESGKGEEFDSFTKLNENIIILYVTELVNINGAFYDKILASKELKFQLKKI